jgi:hypothetical protein
MNIQETLRDGCVLHPRRWSGDTHTDLGGSVDEDATDEVMRIAADYIDFLEETVSTCLLQLAGLTI